MLNFYLNYMKKEMRISYEFIPVLDLLKMKYELVCGDDEYKYLRKVTKLTDLEDVLYSQIFKNGTHVIKL